MSTISYTMTISKGSSTSSAVSHSEGEEFQPHGNIVITPSSDSTFRYYSSYDDEPSSSVDILGEYIGKCIIGDYLVLFTKQSLHDRIYVLELRNNTISVRKIFEGNLNFSNPIEAVGSYERDDIIKVYWVDGKNPNRVINIMDDTQPN